MRNCFASPFPGILKVGNNVGGGQGGVDEPFFELRLYMYIHTFFDFLTGFLQTFALKLFLLFVNALDSSFLSVEVGSKK